MGWPSADPPPGITPGRMGRPPIADRLDHMPPSCSDGSTAGGGAAARVRCRDWIVSNREIRASIASTRVRSMSVAVRAAA